MKFNRVVHNSRRLPIWESPVRIRLRSPPDDLPSFVREQQPGPFYPTDQTTNPARAVSFSHFPPAFVVSAPQGKEFPRQTQLLVNFRERLCVRTVFLQRG